MDEYVTNVSLKYCGTWDIWESVRELCQNSLDETKSLPLFSLNGEGLTIRDTGEGLTLKQLCLLGISEKKSTDARGQYGEGLKIALTIFVRKGYTVRVRSKNFIAYVDKTEKFGEEVLRYRYEETSQYVKGLEITVLGFKDKIDFSERFNVNGNKTVIVKNSYGTMIGEDKPKLYVKNIYVKDLDKDKALFSYDLNNLYLERDRNTPNDFDVCYHIGYLVGDVEDKQVIGTLLDGFRKDTLESRIRHFAPKEIWKTVFYEKYGTNATITDNESIVGKARYHGFKTIIIRNDKIREGLNEIGILETVNAMVLKQKSRVEKEITDLDRTEKENLEKAITIIKNATRLDIPNMKIFESKNGDVLGYANTEGIGIKRIVLQDLGQLLTTLLEETIHYDYKISDVTPEFQVAFGKHMSQILSYVTKEKEGTEFKAKLIRTTLRVKGYIYYQYAIKFPLRHNDKLEGKQYVTIKMVTE